MSEISDFQLNMFVGTPKPPAEKKTRERYSESTRKNANRTLLAAYSAGSAKNARGGRGGVRGGSSRGGSRGGARVSDRSASSAPASVAERPKSSGNSRPVGSRGAAGHAEEMQRAAALKRKRAEASNDDEHDDGLDADGDAEMSNGDAAAAKPGWKAQKQARRDGQAAVSSTAGAASAAAASDDAAAKPAAAPGAAASKKFVRPVAKPLPRIVRHAAAQLGSDALKPVTPSSVPHRSSVFGATENFDADVTMATVAAASSARPASSTKRSGDGVKAEPVEGDGEESAQVKPEPLPLPTTGFGALGLSERVLRALVEKLELKYPTKIQKEGIPLLLAKAPGARRCDALIKSETGSGKTLTYLIPIVERLSTAAVRPERSEGTRALVLAPTRELVLQIQGVLQRLLDAGGLYWLIGGILMGGEKRKSEKARMRRGVHIVVCTPGRLLDHLEHTECFALDKLEYFVLDEADRLMDMGFEKDLARIVQLLDDKAEGKNTIKAGDGDAPPAIVDPRTGLAIQSAASKAATLAASRKARNAEPLRARQNILVSATLNAEIEKMAALTLKKPVLIGFKSDPPASATKVEGDESEPALINGNAAASQLHDTSLPVGLVQHYLQVEHRHRLVGLASLLRKKVVEAEVAGRHFKAVVFFSTCAAVEFHHALFTFSYWPYERNGGGAAAGADKSALLDTQLTKLHGNLTQQERTKTYQQFCKSAEGILLCTDVAARGLDLPAVDYILQYDAPEDTADYVHRVGRTARMGRQGQAVLFLTTDELEYLTHLKDKGILPQALSFASILQSLHSDAAKNKIYNDARGGTPAGAMLQKQFEALIAQQPALQESAINAYHSYLRAYAAYPRALKSIFHPRKLHIGHVARAFALADAPTLLAKSDVVARQRAGNAREKERESERRDMQSSGGVADETATGTNAAAKTATMQARKKLLPAPSAKPRTPAQLHSAAMQSGAAAHAARAPASDGTGMTQLQMIEAAVQSISSGVQPAYGQRDRARNVAAQASDASFHERVAKRGGKAKMEQSSIGWKLGSEGASSGGGGKQSKLARTGIDRARSNKVAAVFRKKKVDLASEFAS